LIYLLKVVDMTKKSKQRFWLEAMMFSLVIVIGFVIASSYFQLTGYEAEFSYIDKDGVEASTVYNMPALVGMNEFTSMTEGTMVPVVETPPIINAGKVTTILWSLIVGTILYLAIRLIARKRIAAIFQPLVRNVNLQLMD